jgi:hypothetical protein
VQSPSWAANWFAASQEIPRISRNQKVHYRIQILDLYFLGPSEPVQAHTEFALPLPLQVQLSLNTYNYFTLIGPCVTLIVA